MNHCGYSDRPPERRCPPIDCPPRDCKPRRDCHDPCDCKPRRDCYDPCDCKPRRECHDPCDCRPHRPPSCKPKPPCPDKQQGVLLNRIVCCDRRFIPSLCADLKLEGLPCCAKPPFRLTMVQQSGAQPWWAPLESKGSRLRLRVTIPVCCQVQDACGEYYSATSTVEVEATLAPQCPSSDCWRNSIIVVPCVRLCPPPVCSEDCCFQARLEVSLELYMTHPEPCMMRKPAPPCPDLPLYPPPITPPRWRQCQEVPVPYGWPTQG